MATPAFDKLGKILSSEHQDGCLDRMVIGGLDKFLASWLREAQAEPVSVSQQGVIDQVVALLQGYAQKTVSDRDNAIRQALKALQPSGDRAEDIVAGLASQEEVRQPRRAPSALGLDSPVETLPGVGPAQARRFKRKGIRTAKDLLYFFPRRHDDFRRLKTISQLFYGEEVTIIGVVQEVRNQPTRAGRQITRAVISDRTGLIEAVWFNQPYLVRQMQIGRRIVLSGRVDQYLGRLTFQRPQWEPWKDDLVHTGRLVPVYSLTEGLTARRVRTLVKDTVERLAPQLVDPLPASILQGHQLVDRATALRHMHFPDSTEELAQARHRLCFEEFLLIQLGVLQQRATWQQVPGRALPADQTLLDVFSRGLPFALTSAQQRSLGEILQDMQQTQPMSRLLQGDVGSGKTVVALGAMLVAVANGMQVAMMAPTEILAEQHQRTLQALLEGISSSDAAQSSEAHILRTLNAPVGLLTGSLSKAEKEEQRRRIANGETSIVVGTHAVIQEGVKFHNLGLVIVDEQHRFGVAQRLALRQKGYHPHVLVMTATPIPRTLALTIYGDLDLSTIDELPPQRQKIQTRWLDVGERERAYSFVRAQVKQGRQAFIVCPLIEESKAIETKAAVAEHRRLQSEVFPDLRLALMHGRLSSSDKEEVMKRFRDREYDILVSTPVVEVGIDVPNATVMLVDGADRFGLAQLHQFRGRVGRGEHASYCMLLAESPSVEAEQRLKVIETTQDGFLLAEEDLKLRGPGEFFGTRQSGLPDLKVAKLGDVRVLEQARQAALELSHQDPALSQPEHRLLALGVREFWGTKTDLS